VSFEVWGMWLATSEVARHRGREHRRPRRISLCNPSSHFTDGLNRNFGHSFE